jgi:hypothetical protein
MSDRVELARRGLTATELVGDRNVGVSLISGRWD